MRLQKVWYYWTGSWPCPGKVVPILDFWIHSSLSLGSTDRFTTTAYHNKVFANSVSYTKAVESFRRDMMFRSGNGSGELPPGERSSEYLLGAILADMRA